MHHTVGPFQELWSLGWEFPSSKSHLPSSLWMPMKANYKILFLYWDSSRWMRHSNFFSPQDSTHNRGSEGFCWKGENVWNERRALVFFLLGGEKNRRQQVVVYIVLSIDMWGIDYPFSRPQPLLKNLWDWSAFSSHWMLYVKCWHRIVVVKALYCWSDCIQPLGCDQRQSAALPLACPCAHLLWNTFFGLWKMSFLCSWRKKRLHLVPNSASSL